jgi:hypothetical protein
MANAAAITSMISSNAAPTRRAPASVACTTQARNRSARLPSSPASALLVSTQTFGSKMLALRANTWPA